MDFVENHTTTKVSFTVKLKPSQLSRMQQSGLEKTFRLKSNLQLTNMNAFDAAGKIQKYNSAESIADAYFPTRLSLYHDRKSVLMAQMEYKANLLHNKARFIRMVSEGKIDLIGGKNSKGDTLSILQNHGFSTIDELQILRNNSSIHSKDSEESSNLDDFEQKEEKEEDIRNDLTSYDYLLKMPLSSLTTEKIAGLTKEAEKTKSELETITSTKPEDIWLTDLDKLAPHL
eukprot:CAMPEP_0178778216 /NCGR_PEP_ID=MMETSP0745-20121128/881_1 /TAXON_ID=913974 /ORGANISM="Nitzschia punctata, Strain CCMP561" /LENGTH=229 /DNA_ID=CAMNT_0020435341 /DNA_START=1 /DNA_END=690 /DNA_ORIENTATION=-